ncbi:MAG TPA: HigA family addiction module antitoxin [Pelomicrobium sp.]|nr:HigA family addiction module antitoxin [Pelomicrobium sp.]
MDAEAGYRNRRSGRPEGTAGAGRESPPRPQVPSTRAPPHPGRFLETRFLAPLGITQQALAVALGVSRRRVNELIRGHRAITADTALRLSVFFRTDPLFWLSLQAAWDAHEARRKLRGLDAAPGRKRVREA